VHPLFPKDYPPDPEIPLLSSPLATFSLSVFLKFHVSSDAIREL